VRQGEESTASRDGGAGRRKKKKEKEQDQKAGEGERVLKRQFVAMDWMGEN